MQEKIVIRGAREHNLKGIDLEIPRDRLVVVTGISGSGKSSLAFDTIYAEGQRRYVESLSAYARQFLGQMEKPDVDLIDGLSPAISIDQKGSSRNPRSTVGTITEIWDHLRLLYARAGTPHCPKCDRPISRVSLDHIVDEILQLPDGTRLLVLGPVLRDRKGEGETFFHAARKAGFSRVRVNGTLYDLDDAPKLDKKKRHSIEVVVDRFVVRRPVDEKGKPLPPEDRSRLSDSVETALKLGEGLVVISSAAAEGSKPTFEERLFSEKLGCPYDGTVMDDLEPRSFSFNSPHGACPECTGLGFRLEVDAERVIDPEKSVLEGGLVPWSRSPEGSWYLKVVTAAMKAKKWNPKTPIGELPAAAQEYLLNAEREDRFTVTYENASYRNTYKAAFEGIIANLERRHRETDSELVRVEIERYMVSRPCPECKGRRLKPEMLAVRVAEKNIAEVAAMPIGELTTWINALTPLLGERERTIAKAIVKEIAERAGFLVDVGLDYLTVDRTATTLSGGEAQRIRLATQIGSRLVGVLYILDEPSIGLHQRDNARLITTLLRLRDLGNTVLVVEHDEETIRTADWIVDIGPGAGELGGKVVVNGTLKALTDSKDSITGAFIRGDRAVKIPTTRRKGSGKSIVVKGAREHNLKGLDVEFPLGRFIAVTGVSGSGKSTLVTDILQKAIARKLHGTKERPGAHDRVTGLDQIDKAIEIDQSPIGRTPRSNPATYVGLFTPIRELFAATQEARLRGYSAGRFSFNVKGGRCETCAGDGILQIEMQFLPDVYVPCETCRGKRYNREALDVTWKGMTIADVLELQVEDALERFDAIPAIRNRLKTLCEVGLGYLRLGQPATTLSGGEAQRIKLATELARRSTGRTAYILDEPTTGLHFADVERLLEVLHRLVDGGNSVIVIEHNLDVIKTADWVIDLGPDGGDRGGELIAEGTPEQVAKVKASHTGRYLALALRGEPIRSLE
ncbi:MAG: excinuclease ABC subunit UvrA [Candidatus Limnocylindrus sp. ZSMar2m-chloro-G89]|nr:MAG: excinuclease ABC subunit UvrA [Candidatus Limnocylindrus sp. ZSMar2m-chloro-G89]